MIPLLLTFKEYSTINFFMNNADNNCGVMYIVHTSTITFEDNCAVNFANNYAHGNGGVMYIDHSSSITSEG